MTYQPLKLILDCTFRSNPEYEIIAFEQMLPAEQSALKKLQQGSDFFGILRPLQKSGESIKAVCKNTALLLNNLKEAGRLPAVLLDGTDDHANHKIAELVLDGVLEISYRGRFVTGAEAHDAIHDTVKVADNKGRIARLSIEAVKYGQRLAIDDPIKLSAQMYFYNRVPMTPKWKRTIGADDLFSEFMGIAKGGRCADILEAHWTQIPYSPERAGWKSWTSKQTGGRRRRISHDFKLYVSPILDVVADVLYDIVDVFTETGVSRFKIGADLPGLTRPDKIVAYFDTFEHLAEVGRRLDERLGEVPVHGVPFTADLCRNGLLSWGMDPHEKPVLDWQMPSSWRLWITNHLAGTLLMARKSSMPSKEHWRFALKRLQLTGIDTESWTPTPIYEQKIGQ